jgi:hypothetical protein
MTDTSLKHEIDAITTDRMKVERENPGFFWDDKNDIRMIQE